jgi:hypothetical protein
MDEPTFSAVASIIENEGRRKPRFFLDRVPIKPGMALSTLETGGFFL